MAINKIPPQTGPTRRDSNAYPQFVDRARQAREGSSISSCKPVQITVLIASAANCTDAQCGIFGTSATVGHLSSRSVSADFGSDNRPA